MTMRVALDLSATQRPRLTGWERFALSLRDALDRCEGVDIVPLLMERPSQGRWSTLLKQLWWYWRGSSAAARRCDPSLVHALTFPPGRLEVPTVWTVHDTLILGEHRRFAGPGSRIWAPLARRALERVGAIVTDTHSVADELRGLGVPDHRLCVVTPGTTDLPDTGTRPVQTRRIRDGAACPLPDEYLLMVGTLEKRKRPDVAVAVARRLELPIILVGRIAPSLDTSSLARWEHAYHGQGVDDRHLTWLYDHALAVLAPSAYEGFDLPVIEALSRGTRVIASRTPVHEEVGASRCTYFAVDDVEDAASAVSAALEQGTPDAVGLPTWEAAAEGYMKVYREVLAPSPS